MDTGLVFNQFGQAASAMTGLVSSWPTWASYPFLGLLAVLILGLWSQKSEAPSSKTTAKEDLASRQQFEGFKTKYVVLYIVLMLSDWVQGTNMYTLYQGYGVDIGTLFLTGFGTSAFFSMWIGPYIDKYGRKKACILYCIGEVVINVLEHSHDFRILMVGRVIGGLTTALLFTSFESWMVSSHRERGFQKEWLAETFTICSVGNGLIAVFSGVISQLMADWMGDIGPFRLAVALSAFVGVYIAFAWEENYGNSAPDKVGVGAAMKTIAASPEIALCGIMQATFQGAMFTFVFMWVPVMFSVAPGGVVPTGLVYASLMAAIAIGGCILSHVQTLAPEKQPSDETISIIIFAVSAVAMLIPVLAPSLYPTFFAFLLFEMCVGAYDGVAGIIRSKYIPDGQSGAIMNVFRVPLNALVVFGTKMHDWYPHKYCFVYCVAWHLVTLVLAVALRHVSATAQKVEQRGAKKTQ